MNFEKNPNPGKKNWGVGGGGGGQRQKGQVAARYKHKSPIVFIHDRLLQPLL